MAFGIGGGIYFLYFPLLRLKDSVLVVMRSRPGFIIRNFVKRMGVGYHEQTFGNDVDKAQQALDDLIAKGVPVGVGVNILGLKYLNDLGFDLDYNGHHMTVIGKEGSQYIVYVTGWPSQVVLRQFDACLRVYPVPYYRTRRKCLDCPA